MMRQPIRYLYLIVLFGALTMSAVAAQEAAGNVSRVRGEATARFGPETRSLTVGSAVFAGDRILTGKNTRLEITMVDEAVVTLGDESEFSIGEFEEAARGRIFGLFQGVFLAVSGQLAKGRTSPMTVQTRLATIGIRGTTVWGVQSPEKLQVVLLDGRIFVESVGRRVELTEPRTLTTVLPGAPPTAPVRVSDEALEAAQRTVAFE
jgi:hypothetical protein